MGTERQGARAACRGLRVGSVLLAGLLSACVHSVARDPQPTVPLQLGQAAGPVLEQPWWQGFAAPELTGLITMALDYNLTLEAALARLDQADALAGQAGSGRFPSLELRANASRARSIFFLGEQPVQSTTNRYSLSAAASYEVDLWGRVRRGHAAAREDRWASALDATAAAHSVAAQVAETWLSIIELRQRMALTRAQLDTNARFLELTRLRFEQGGGSVLAIRQQEQQTAGVRAQLPLLQAQLAVLINQMTVLTGGQSGDAVGAAAALPALPGAPLSEVPGDLLLQRPDVQAAQRRLVAADHRVGAAIAERLPGLRLTGSTGYDAQSTANLFDDLIWSVAAGLVAPVFDAGRLANAQAQRQAVLRERLAQFNEAALQAVAEVRNALAQEQFQREHLAAQRAREAASRAVLDAARERYSNGLSDFLPVLTALVTLQADQQAVLTAQRQLLAYRVQLHRAIGGHWPDTVHEETAP